MSTAVIQAHHGFGERAQYVLTRRPTADRWLPMPGLTPRLLLITALIVPLNCYFLLQMELVRYTFPTWVVPLSNVVFVLSGLLIVNRAVRRIAPAKALRVYLNQWAEP